MKIKKNGLFMKMTLFGIAGLVATTAFAFVKQITKKEKTIKE